MSKNGLHVEVQKILFLGKHQLGIVEGDKFRANYGLYSLQECAAIACWTLDRLVNDAGYHLLHLTGISDTIRFRDELREFAEGVMVEDNNTPPCPDRVGGNTEPSYWPEPTPEEGGLPY